MQESIYQVGGSLKFNHPTYVERKADHDLLNSLKKGKFCYVFNCRQMGKSSLRVRVMHQLQAKGMACASVDITSLGSDINQFQWYSGLISQLFLGLNLIGKINLKVWLRERETMSPVQIFSQFLEEVVLTYCPHEKIFIFIDEIDKVLSLPFSLDDFFSLIRYFYNQRAENPNYNRLTFALFGVATPSDLIREKTQTPFNIGQAIELTGFTLTEVEPLKQGLLLQFSEAESLLSEILKWTGGQPFLTQKVCDLLLREYQDFLELNSADLIHKIIEKYIISNWESQDEPIHLKTIRDRLFRQEEKTGRLLGVYQKILEEGSIIADNSPEQTELRLSGLVVKQQNNLISYNKIYQSIFNSKWVTQQLENIRPYSEAIAAWINSNYQDQSRLLRGKALQDALLWSENKNLSDIDNRFLRNSQILEQQESDRSRAILEKINKQATRLMQAGVGIFIVSLIGAFLAIQQAWYQEKNAKLAIKLQEESNNAVENFKFDQIGGLISAMEAGQQLKTLVKPDTQLHNYPTTTPLLSLQQILNNIQEKNLIEAHKDGITAVSMSPDGYYLATTSWDGTAKLWDKQGKLQKIITKTQDYLYDISFSPDGETLLIASSDGTAKLWNLQGELLTTFKGHKKDVYRAAFSPNGQFIVTTSLDQTAILWTIQGEQVTVLKGHDNSVDEAAFSPDGQQIVTVSRDGTAKLWDLKGNLLESFSDQGISLYSVAFSPDGQTIATAAKDGTVKVWNIVNKSLKTFKGHQKLIFRVRFSPDGKQILSASSDGTARIWNLNGETTEVLQVSQEPVTDIVKNGDLVVTTSLDGLVKIWQTTLMPSGEFNTLNRRVTRAAFSIPDNRIFIAYEGGTIAIWDLKSNLIQKWETNRNWIYGLNISPDGKQLATASGGGKIQLWDLKGQKIAELTGNESRVYGMSFNPDQTVLATAAKDGTVKLISIKENKELKMINAHNDWIYDVTFDPTGNYLATASKDKTAKIWDKQGNLLSTLTGHQDIVTKVQFSPDGEYLLTASRDGTAKLWDKQGNLLKSLESDRFQLSAIQFSQDNKAIATASTDGTIRLWDIQGNLRGEYKNEATEIVNLEFTPDNNQLITINGEGRVKIWSIKTEYDQLESFLEEGCTWLADYLVSRPQKSESLSVCFSHPK